MFSYAPWRTSPRVSLVIQDRSQQHERHDGALHSRHQGAFTDWYPYPFLDVTELGFGPAVRNAALVLVLGVALSATLKLLDAKLPVLVGLLRRR